MKYYHIQLTEDSGWTKEIGHCLSEVMCNLIPGRYDLIPYAWFTTEYEY